jgi:hypothetical protein
MFRGMSNLTAALGTLSLTSIGRLSEDDARRLIEAARWPDGVPVCPRCGVVGEATLMESAKDTENPVRLGLYNCRACREPFTCTVGTVMESSHIPLVKWLMGFFLMTSSLKGVSARQLWRQLPLGSYKTAWFMAHRIRLAMANGGPFKPLTGIVEADETWIGGKPRHTARQPGAPVPTRTQKIQKAQAAFRERNIPVAVLVSRDGNARARALTKVGAEELREFIVSNVDVKAAALRTDEHKGYVGVGREFTGGHERVNHKRKEYARPGGIHSNTAESFHSLFKRAYHGAWHHVSREHLDRYLGEQCFRWSNRHMKDAARTTFALGQIGGARLYYKKPKGRTGTGDGLVANG